MAKNDQFTAQPLLGPLERGQGFPLDSSHIYETLKAAENYAATNAAYVGQYIAVNNGNAYDGYMIVDGEGTLIRVTGVDVKVPEAASESDYYRLVCLPDEAISDKLALSSDNIKIHLGSGRLCISELSIGNVTIQASGNVLTIGASKS